MLLTGDVEKNSVTVHGISEIVFIFVVVEKVTARNHR
jgi:hypothetical protein